MVQYEKTLGSKMEKEARRDKKLHGDAPSMGYHDIIIIVYYLVIGCDATRKQSSTGRCNVRKKD